MQQSFTTPMMKQYFQIKKQYQDCLLFYRMGDFYELFMEDAHTGAKVLNITLTSRAKGKDGRIPMAGVPYHAVDSYISKLVKAGFKVAICEQVSLPNKYGIVDREVIRIVTPGTILDEKALEKKDNNYIIALYTNEDHVAVSVADISTGYFSTVEIKTDNIKQTMTDELSRIHPSECILPDDLYNDPPFLRMVKTEKNINIFPFQDWNIYASDCDNVLKKHFGVVTLEGFGIADKPFARKTAAVLLGYLQQTQKGPVGHIKKLTGELPEKYLMIDRSTMLNLELFSTIREHDIKGTLLSVLDQTNTAMGGRLLKQWIKKPLADRKEINSRYDAIDAFLEYGEKSGNIISSLKKISDIERVLSRLAVGLGNGRDLINLAASLKVILEIKHVADTINSALTAKIVKNISPEIEEIVTYIDSTIVPQPPFSLREGGIIMAGVNTELDNLRKISGGSRDWILELERTERERTDISSLKVRYNQVFGFYIEISKPNLHLVPDNYLRRQTLVNGERFTTVELKQQEEIILSAEQKIHDLEYALFQDVLKQVLSCVGILQEAAQSIAILDCLLNFATLAQKNKYVRPVITENGEMDIIDGRHPVVEHLLENKLFVPNSVSFTSGSQQLILITGPNMAGKSVFIRQVALLVLMAQMGSFIPAKEAHISLCDRIFVRSGASDVITSGLSTFMVEMVETAQILNHATKDSLIIMDEIGRGTSTYDGISIARAVAEYLVQTAPESPKTLFATHYHELQILEEKNPRSIKNHHMAVAGENTSHVSKEGEPVFLYTLQPGGASHSYGVAVAKLAGIPCQVIDRANELLEEFEQRTSKEQKPVIQQISIQDADIIPQQYSIESHIVQKELEFIDIAQMTPLEAMNKLAELKEKLRLISGNSRDISKAD